MSNPNLLFIMSDQQKATSLDLYNQEVNFIETKALRMLADEGVLFEAAYCPYPLCVPSRISMLTGMYPTYSGMVSNKPFMEDTYDSIFSAAKRNNYRTFLVGKDHAHTRCAGVGGEKGKHPEFMDAIFDRMYLAGHNHFQPPEIQRDLPEVKPWLNAQPALQRIWGSEVAPWNSDMSITARLEEVAEEYLKDWDKSDRPKGIPFAMWLSFPDPHEFYQAAKDLVEMIDPNEIQLPPNWESDIQNRSEYIQFMHWYFNQGDVPQEDIKKLIRIYLAMCKGIDLYLEKLFAFMKEMGLWENTIMIYTSDHGDFNGEHGLVHKFDSGYDGCTRVPLIFAWPGKTIKGRRYEYPVNLCDIPSTLCDLMGFDRLEEDQGMSMANILMAEEYEDREYTVVEAGVPGDSLSTVDIENFPGHRYDVPPVGRWSYNPPHRYAGKLYAVRSKDYKLIVRQGQASEFFDMKNDPWEKKNIIGDPVYQGEILKHYHYLAQHLCRIASKHKDSFIMPGDAWYKPGIRKKWEDCVPEEVKNNKND